MPHARRWKTSARKTLKLLGHRTPQSRRVLQCRCTTQPILSAERQPPRVGQLEGEENGEKDGTVPCTHKNKHMHKKRVQAHGCCLNWMCTEAAAEGKKKKKAHKGGTHCGRPPPHQGKKSKVCPQVAAVHKGCSREKKKRKHASGAHTVEGLLNTRKKKKESKVCPRLAAVLCEDRVTSARGFRHGPCW